jgi:tripartite-type tricarboxylate transporter receptor subunit TctC
VLQIEQQGAVPDYTTRQQFADMIRESNERWQQVVTDIKFEKL